MLLLLDLLDDDDESLLALGGGVEVFAPVITGDYPFFSSGFFSAGFFSDGFWGDPGASLKVRFVVRLVSRATPGVLLISRL